MSADIESFEIYFARNKKADFIEFLIFWQRNIKKYVEADCATEKIDDILSDKSGKIIKLEGYKYCLHISGEPLFNFEEGFDTLLKKIMKLFIIKHPDTNFSVFYEFSSTRCEDRGCYSLDYSKHNLTYWYSNHEINKELDDYDYIFKLKDGKWIYPKNYNLSDVQKAKSLEYVRTKAVNAVEPIFKKTRQSGVINVMASTTSLPFFHKEMRRVYKHRDIKLRIDFIDIPFIVEVVSEEIDSVKFLVRIRRLYGFNEEGNDVYVIWRPMKNNKYHVEIKDIIPEKIEKEMYMDYEKFEKNLVKIIKMYQVIRGYIDTTESLADYETTSINLEHLVIYVDNDEIKSKILFGQDRPSVLGANYVVQYFIRPCAWEKRRLNDYGYSMLKNEYEV